jgi:aspartate/methionine/tyrosine aminotransferase
MKFCQKYQIHLVSDEIYALSVWKNTVDNLEKDPVPFESVLSIDTDGIIDPSLVHVLWGTSKDFGANGIRLGVMISLSNQAFLSSCRTCALNSAPSSLAENAVLHILGNKEFLSSYIKKNQKRLSEAYTFAVQLLKSYSIPYTPGASSAFFLWVNLGKKYAERHPELADSKDPQTVTYEIFEKLMANKVFVVHGGATGAEEPGWFRLVFTQPKYMVEEGIKRIADVIK